MNEHYVSMPTKKDEIFTNIIDEVKEEEKVEELSKLDYGEGPYLEATLAKDKILSMAASDASFNLTKIYSILQEQNSKLDVKKEDIPSEAELDTKLSKYSDNSGQYKSEFESNLKKCIDTLKANILKHSMRDTQNMWTQTEEEYVHVSEIHKLNDVIDSHKQKGDANLIILVNVV